MIYVVINESEVVMATRDEDKALAFSLNSTDEIVREVVEDSGRDIDDLTDEELNEFGVMAGFEGGYFYVESLDENYVNENDEVELNDGTVINSENIITLLEEDEVDEEFEVDGDIDDLYNDFEDDFDDNEDDW